MKYALLFSGGVNESYNYLRYKNDLGFMYKVLLKAQGYQHNNINVLFADGQTIVYDGISISTKSATKVNFDSTVSNLEKLLNPEDQLLIAVSNHGSNDGIICTWGNGFLNKDDFLNKFSNLICKKIFIFGQCYGGDFINTRIPNSIILSANSKNKVSYCSAYLKQNSQLALNLNYDEFLYNLFSYVMGSYPSGENLKESKQGDSLYDAYQYAKKYDIFKPGAFYLKETDISEVPQIKEYGLNSKEIEI